MRNCWEISADDRPTFNKLAAQFEKMLSDQVDYLDLTNNAIHNRSYFCSPLGDTQGTKKHIYFHGTYCKNIFRCFR